MARLGVALLILLRKAVADPTRGSGGAHNPTTVGVGCKQGSADERLLDEPSTQEPSVHRLSRLGEDSLKRQTKELEDLLSAKTLTPLSSPTYAFYNPPWTLPFLRRNEVLVEIPASSP
jgi:SOUL heme-binding protein